MPVSRNFEYFFLQVFRRHAVNPEFNELKYKEQAPTYDHFHYAGQLE